MKKGKWYNSTLQDYKLIKVLEKQGDNFKLLVLNVKDTTNPKVSEIEMRMDDFEQGLYGEYKNVGMTENIVKMLTSNNINDDLEKEDSAEEAIKDMAFDTATNVMKILFPGWVEKQNIDELRAKAEESLTERKRTIYHYDVNTFIAIKTLDKEWFLSRITKELEPNVYVLEFYDPEKGEVRTDNIRLTPTNHSVEFSILKEALLNTMDSSMKLVPGRPIFDSVSRKVIQFNPDTIEFIKESQVFMVEGLIMDTVTGVTKGLLPLMTGWYKDDEGMFLLEEVQTSDDDFTEVKVLISHIDGNQQSKAVLMPLSAIQNSKTKHLTFEEVVNEVKATLPKNIKGVTVDNANKTISADGVIIFDGTLEEYEKVCFYKVTNLKTNDKRETISAFSKTEMKRIKDANKTTHKYKKIKNRCHLILV